MAAFSVAMDVKAGECEALPAKMMKEEQRKSAKRQAQWKEVGGETVKRRMTLMVETEDPTRLPAREAWGSGLGWGGMRNREEILHTEDNSLNCFCRRRQGACACAWMQASACSGKHTHTQSISNPCLV